MKLEISVDASAQDGNGFAVGVVIDWIDGASEVDQAEYKKHIDRETKSTNAEVYAAIFGLEKAVYDVENPDEISVVLQSDCEYVIEFFDRILNSDIDSQSMSRLERIAMELAYCFDGFWAYWIPRETNIRADRLAKATLTNNKND